MSIAEVHIQEQQGVFSIKSSNIMGMPKLAGNSRRTLYANIVRHLPATSEIHIVGPAGQTRTVIPSRAAKLN